MKTIYLKSKYDNGEKHVSCISVNDVEAYMIKKAREGENLSGKHLTSLELTDEMEYEQFSLACRQNFLSQFDSKMNLGDFDSDCTKHFARKAAKSIMN